MNERENLRERASYYLLARFIPGEVFHVDSLVNSGKVVFFGCQQVRPATDAGCSSRGCLYIANLVTWLE
jgi:hypothetical protein